MGDPMNVAAVSRKPMTLAVGDIIVDPDLQPRQRIDITTSEEYSHALIDGAIFPPVVVFCDGTRRWRLCRKFPRWPRSGCAPGIALCR